MSDYETRQASILAPSVLDGEVRRTQNMRDDITDIKKDLSVIKREMGVTGRESGGGAFENSEHAEIVEGDHEGDVTLEDWERPAPLAEININSPFHLLPPAWQKENFLIAAV